VTSWTEDAEVVKTAVWSMNALIAKIQTEAAEIESGMRIYTKTLNVTTRGSASVTV
jgi:hypothetical protein